MGAPGSGALEAPGGERGSGTMSGLSGPLSRPGPRPSALLFLFLLGPSSVAAISFHLPVNSRKCLREEIHKDLLVTGAYEITDQSGGAGGLRTHLKVRPGAARGRAGGTMAGLVRGRPRPGEGGRRAEAGGWLRLPRPPPPPLHHPSGEDVRRGPPPSPRALGVRGAGPRARSLGPWPGCEALADPESPGEAGADASGPPSLRGPPRSGALT